MTNNINPILYYSTSGLVSSSGYMNIPTSNIEGSPSVDKPSLISSKRIQINVAPFSLLADYSIVDDFGNSTKSPTFVNPKYNKLTNVITELDFCVTFRCSTSRESFVVHNYINAKVIKLGETFELIQNDQKFAYQEPVNPDLIKVLKSLLNIEISNNSLLIGLKYIKNTNFPKNFPNITTYNYINSLFGFMYSCNYNDTLTIKVESIM